MLQVDVSPFASDALEDAMRLAQTKSLNSYTFSDCLNFLNYVWSDIYSQICLVDSGYYSKTVQLTSKLTKLPKFVKNSIMIYAAQSPVDHNRFIYRQANNRELLDNGTYLISGTDLWCPDAERRKVWLEYSPQPAQIFFTHHNRDPKLYPSEDKEKYLTRIKSYGLYNLKCLLFSEYISQEPFNPEEEGLYEQRGYDYVLTNDIEPVNDKVYYIEEDIDINSVSEEQIASAQKWVLRHKNQTAGIPDENITMNILQLNSDKVTEREGKWELKYISCDFPYIFCSYQNSITEEWLSGFFNKQMEWTTFNPFDWTGRNNNVEYINCKYNDKTGLGVLICDHNDLETKLDNTTIPSREDSVIYVNSYYEYKASDGTVEKFTKGYWYNRFPTDFGYEPVETVDELLIPSAFDDKTVVLLSTDSKLYRLDKTQGLGEWKPVTESVTQVAIPFNEPRIKELGWTPDTKLVYPAPEVYRYLVARLAEKFAALNESNIMGVQSELTDARFAFQAFLKKDKSAWERIRNVNPATLGDWL